MTCRTSRNCTVSALTQRPKPSAARNPSATKSGSNTICAVTALLEAGVLPAVSPVTTVTIDTAVGTVRAEATVQDGRVASVTVANVPAYVVRLDRPLELPEYGTN